MGLGRLVHWGPIAALGRWLRLQGVRQTGLTALFFLTVIIFWVSFTALVCDTMYWPPDQSWGGYLNLMVFLMISSSTLYHFMAALLVGPGHVPEGWQPAQPTDQAHLQFCHACQAFKAPRSHHCRKCGKCVKKMDHHCPWINNCVGHDNHGFFVGFLASAVLGCSHASWILAMSIYYGLNRSWYAYYGTGQEPQVMLTLVTLIVYLFGLGMAIGVVLAVGTLLFFQLRSVVRNQTGIEDWILEKASYRLRHTTDTFAHPYDLGRSGNFWQVINLTCRPMCDGIEWPLKPGSDQYDLTKEQILQKLDKRHRTREYKIVKPFSGYWCPCWSMGLRVGCQPPCADEPRIPLEVGDILLVTRWKRHWLYGDKCLRDNQVEADRVRGWFPRKCAVEVIEPSFNGDEVKPTKKSDSCKKNE
eukprot:maker-scaffold301_size216225-snap-gene-1.27 protein:Tk06239 transcript:maker-scaffold301_size216225-snap-gene-1.27-mRNA-1 annotation:"palmitoyltransferase zdhhc6"